jgi:hypothetical protein
VIGKTINNNNYTNILLASLPPLYNSICSIINVSAYISKVKLTPHTIIQLTTDEYKHCATKNGNNNKDKAFTANAKSKKKNLKCYNCKKHSYIRAKCWVKGGGKKGQGPQHKAKAKAKDNTLTAEKATNIKAWVAIEELTSKGEGEGWDINNS